MILSLFLTAAALAASGPRFVERPCSDVALGRFARCGTVTVRERRTQANGRKLALNIIVMRPTGNATLPPLFDLEGGPGLASTKNAIFYAVDGANYRAHRPIVLIDQRGTGGSNPLRCEALAAPAAAFQPVFDEAAVIRCRNVLSRRADLTRYGTDEAVADLDEVRRALGYQQIDLIALSYGTTVALRYLALHGARVRAAVLAGTVPTSAMPPSRHAEAAQRAFGLIAAQCRADKECHAAYDLERDLAAALARLPAIAGAPERDVFLEKLRSRMYSAAGARTLPFIVRRAAEGDLAPFFSATRPTEASPFADGQYLSITCAESIALIDYPAAARAARATLFSDYRLRRQRQACSHWPRARVAPGFLAPVSSRAAVLLLSGSLDPVALPEWAAKVARTLPNARIAEIPAAGHIIDGLTAIDSCYDPLVVRFLEIAGTKALDTRCLAEMAPPPFLLRAAPR